MVQVDEAFDRVQPHRAGHYEATACPLHQSGKVEGDVFLRISTAQVAGYHARVVVPIGRRDESQPKRRNAVDDQPAQHLQMSVASTYQ
jgi:hypothetical protein